MDQRDAWPPTYEHTCTFEDRRFGTCHCWRDSIRSVDGSSGATEHLRQPARDSSWVQDLRDEQAAQFKVALKRHLESMPSGQRIRLLRTVCGWTQRQAAIQLGISRRTLIRHEQCWHRRSWISVSLLMRLRQVESDHVEQLLAHVSSRL